MNKARIESFIKNSPLVRIKEEEFRGDTVYVVKYKNKVFYDNLWTPELEALRGVVLDKDYNLISNPFLKVFNNTESGHEIGRERSVLAVQKINGFMAACTFYKGKLLVSTSGTISSPFADMAYEWIKPHEPYLQDMASRLNNPTFIFEICDPSDPHIVEENAGVYLIGVREVNWEADQNMLSQSQLDSVAEQMHMMRPYWRTHKQFSTVLDEIKDCRHEGYMIYDIGGNPPLHYLSNPEPIFNTVKLKSPFYLTLKFLGRMSKKKEEIIFTDPEKLKRTIDEEFYGIVDHIATIRDKYVSMKNEERIKYIREYFLGNLE